MLNCKQIDIFGNEKDTETFVYTTLGTGRTLKSRFRQQYGYNEEHQCKNCKHFIQQRYNDKSYFKCKKLGITSSSATDIRKSDIACNLYEEGDNKC